MAFSEVMIRGAGVRDPHKWVHPPWGRFSASGKGDPEQNGVSTGVASLAIFGELAGMIWRVSNGYPNARLYYFAARS